MLVVYVWKEGWVNVMLYESEQLEVKEWRSLRKFNAGHLAYRLMKEHVFFTLGEQGGNKYGES